MIEIKLLEVAGLASALQALHLPFGKECDSIATADSWDVRSKQNELSTHGEWHIVMSEHDKSLLRALISRGDEHAKVLRGVIVYLEINAPRYWWVEMDTYRVGKEQLASESTMHIQGRGLSEEELVKMKSELKEGTMQKRVIMVSYQTLRRICKQRHNHRLPEWREFCNWILDNVPYNWMLQ